MQKRHHISRSIVRGLIAFGLVFVVVVTGFFFQDSLRSYFSPKADTAGPASVSVSPASGTYKVGDQFIASFILNTGGKSVSTVGIDVSYSDTLEYVESNVDGSDFTTIADPVPSGNHFKFDRWRTNGGYTGTNGLLFKVTFKAKSAGTGTITVNKDQTLIIEDTAQDASILGSVVNGSYTITAADTTPPPTGNTGGDGTTTSSSSSSDSSAVAVSTDSNSSTSTTPSTTSTTTTTKPKTTTKKTTPTTTKKTEVTPAPTPAKTQQPTPSAINSTLLTDGKCHVSKTFGQMAVAIGDGSGKLITGADYKPTIALDPATGVTQNVVQGTNGIWRVDITSNSAQTVTATISSKDVALGSRQLEFKDSCAVASATTTTPTPTTSDVSKPVTTTPATTTPKKATDLPLIAGVIALLVVLAGSGFVLIRRIRSSANSNQDLI